MRLVALQTRDDRIGEPVDGGRSSAREVTIDTGPQPFRDPADGKRGDRYPVHACFGADKAERFRPEARHHDQIRPGVKASQVLGLQPPGEFHVDHRFPAAEREGALLPFRSLRAFPGKRDMKRPANRPHDLRQRVDELSAALDRLHASDKEQMPAAVLMLTFSEGLAARTRAGTYAVGHLDDS